MAKVLLAGDDFAAIDQMDAAISAEGYETITATNGLEAQELALSEQPDLILLEAKLSVFDGFETCQMLRGDPEIPKEVPIVIVSDEDFDPHKVERFQVSEVFPKTHGSVLLIEAVVRWLGNKAG